MQEEEEKLLENSILGQVPWERLSPQLKFHLDNSKEIWKQKVVKYSIKHQLRWKVNLVKNLVTEEKSYYQEIVRISQLNLMLYPYHISDVLIKGLRITPFRYYHEMMQEVMKNDYSYDRVPNFTATDCVRLLGIGRNEYIDIMNKFRAKGWIFKTKKNMIKDLLPTVPVEIPMDHWWHVRVGYVSEEDIKNCTEKEHQIVDTLIKSHFKQAGEIDKTSLMSLYKKQLVYLEIPINNGDFIQVPPLENFVMNRVSGDYFENLLYKIFVSTDERTSVEQLSGLLGIDIELVKQALSVYCRLGFAKKKNIEPLTQDQETTSSRKLTTKWHPSWTENVTAPVSNQNILDPQFDPSADFSKKKKRIGFVFDYTLTALLMMGNLGNGLKNHAVTMYEVGKLADESLDEFLQELEKVKEEGEGETQTYHDHAITLRNILQFLRDPKLVQIEDCEGVDLIRSERLTSLDTHTRERMLAQNYGILISMAPISSETHAITSCIPHHFGPTIPEVNTSWFKLFLYKCAESGPISHLFSRGRRIRRLSNLFQSSQFVKLSTWSKEAAVHNANQVLLTLNEALLDGPVLLQAYGSSQYPITIDISFPFNEDFEGNIDEYNAANLHMHPSLKKIGKHIDLNSTFGFVRMLKIENMTKEEAWVPLEIYFGLPLNQAKLAREITAKIQKFDLFSKKNLQQHSRSTRLLSLRLLEFIASFQIDENLHELGQAIAFPRSDIQFTCQNQIQELSNFC